ncbi:MAG: MarR family winged helix-turn-helix transcriptional regulator [Muribaculaceae bacterium]|nr:MarR family winged helix-turn-helix transcriptional regulator [Muribaculaceae bacterium]
MKQEYMTYGGPNSGCLVGTAYQKMVSDLNEILREKVKELSVPEYMVLRSLYHRDGLQQCEICDIIGKDKGAVCRTVKSLIRKELVYAEIISHKCLKVYLTPKGESLRSEILKIADERERDLETLLGPKDLKIFLSCLKKIIE